MSDLATALEPVLAAIGRLPTKARGMLIEEIADEFARLRPEPETRKALALDQILSSALFDAPLSSRVRAAPRIARCVRAAPQTSLALATDVVTVAESLLAAPDADDSLLAQVCAPDRQDHMRVIARRAVVTEPVTDRIAPIADLGTALALAGNSGARFSRAAFESLAARAEGEAELRTLLRQRIDCPSEIAERFAAGSGGLSVEQLTSLCETRCAEGDLAGAVDQLMAAIGRDRDAGRRLIEREDEKSLGAVCHAAGVDASVYEILIEALRVQAGKPLGDVRKAPVRFRLMRPVEIDRLLSRLPMAAAGARAA